MAPGLNFNFSIHTPLDFEVGVVHIGYPVVAMEANDHSGARASNTSKPQLPPRARSPVVANIALARPPMAFCPN